MKPITWLCFFVLFASIIFGIACADGWDLRYSYCPAANAALVGQNPYSEHSFFPFVYPFFTMVFFIPLCAITSIIPFWLIYLALYLLLVFLVWQLFEGELLYCATITFAGFSSFFWSCITGNIFFCFGFPAILLLYYFTKNKAKAIALLLVGAFVVLVFINVFAYQKEWENNYDYTRAIEPANRNNQPLPFTERFMVYEYGIVALFVYFFSRNWNNTEKTITIFLVCALPILFFASSNTFLVAHSQILPFWFFVAFFGLLQLNKYLGAVE